MPGRDPNNFLRLLESPGSTADYYLFRVDGREMLSTPYEFRLTIRSQGDIPQASTWIGSSISFVMGPSDDVHRTINGRCVRFEHAYQKGAYVEFVLDVAPTLAGLRLKRDNRIFVDKSAKQIIDQVLNENQIVFDDAKVKSANTPREYCVQYNESDFDFISRLMENEGIYYYFRYDAGAGRFKHKLYLADDPSGFFDGDPFSLSFRRDHMLRGLEAVETSYSAVSGAATSHDYDFKQPKSLTPTRTASRLDYADKSTAVYNWPGGGPKPDGVRRHSKLAMEEAESASLLIEGTGSYVGFTPGARYEIDDSRLVARERRIAIRSVVHAAWDPAGLEEGEPSYQQHFSAIPSQQAYRPPSTTAPAVVRGPQTAVVLDQHDGDGFGRIKVRFHWDHASASTCWLRVAQQWAGGQIGAQFVPRVGMEVLVDFLEGDPDRPLVVGCVYNGDNKHPFDVPANLSQAGWRTKSHPQGDVVNVFMFEDKAGGEEIYTFAGRNLRRETVKDEDVDIKGQSKLHVGKDHDETVDGQVTLKIGKSSSTKTGGDFKVHADGAIELTSAQSIKISVGGSSISITPTGVKITGPLVELN